MPSPSPVELAIDCMWERYSEPLSLTDIARSAALSRFHFSRIFKEATGVSPRQFLIAVRMHQAKRMLLATSMNVADVAVAVGYSSLGSFTNRFTDSVGVSPGQFRRAARPQLLPDHCDGPATMGFHLRSVTQNLVAHQPVVDVPGPGSPQMKTLRGASRDRSG